jgi:hypothetical protein
MSAIDRIARGSTGGTGARNPSRTASVPLTYPVRPMSCAKIVKAFLSRGFDDDVVGLRGGDAEFVDGHGVHVQAIGRDDRHLQARNAHIEMRHRRSVDETQAHLFASRNSAVQLPSAVVPFIRYV